MLGCLLSRSRSSVTLCLLIYFPGLMPTGMFISTAIFPQVEEEKDQSI